MSTEDKSLALLPNGFCDLLPPFAQKEADAIRALMQEFILFGYQRIKPPLIEFEDSLLAPGPGERLAPETFRLMDPISHRMLGVRSDITPQISRIAESRLTNAPRPLRLTYANDVLRTTGSQMRTNRQFTQVGCEVIGGKGQSETDVEVCVLSLQGLRKLGLSDITIDFTIPGFVDGILHGVSDADRERIYTYVRQRDYDALIALGTDAAQKIAQAMSASG